MPNTNYVFDQYDFTKYDPLVRKIQEEKYHANRKRVTKSNPGDKEKKPHNNT